MKLGLYVLFIVSFSQFRYAVVSNIFSDQRKLWDILFSEVSLFLFCMMKYSSETNFFSSFIDCITPECSWIGAYLNLCFHIFWLQFTRLVHQVLLLHIIFPFSPICCAFHWLISKCGIFVISTIGDFRSLKEVISSVQKIEDKIKEKTRKAESVIRKWL